MADHAQIHPGRIFAVLVPVLIALAAVMLVISFLLLLLINLLQAWSRSRSVD